MATEKQIDTVTEHYLIACIWADAPEGMHPRVTKSAREKARQDCAAFIKECGLLFDQAMACEDYGWYQGHRNAEAAFGHDYYLTRQRHGVGFWDRDGLPKGLRDALTYLCRHKEANVEFYGGWLYLR